MNVFWLCVALAACHASGSESPASTGRMEPPTRPAATSLAGAQRCHEAVAHMDSFETARPAPNPDDPPPGLDDPPPSGPPPSAAEQAKRQRDLEQARAAGILADPTHDCVASWTNTVVDCILAAKDARTANACVPATASR